MFLQGYPRVVTPLATRPHVCHRAWIRPIGRIGSGLLRQGSTPPRRGSAYRLPCALREWYERPGCRGDLWSVQDIFLTPEELTLRGDLLAFYVENQAVWFIGIRRATRPPMTRPP